MELPRPSPIAGHRGSSPSHGRRLGGDWGPCIRPPIFGEVVLLLDACENTNCRVKIGVKEFFVLKRGNTCYIGLCRIIRFQTVKTGKTGRSRPTEFLGVKTEI